MKILLINNFHYRRGGSETVYLNTGDLLKLHGHEVVYFSQKCPENIPDKNDDLFPERVDPESANICRKLVGVVNYFYNSRAACLLEKLIQRERPDIAHIHMLWGGLSPSIFHVLRRYNIPIVHTVHDYRMVCPAYLFKDGKGKICEKCYKGHYLNCIRKRCSKGSLVLSIIMTLEMYFRNIFFNPVKNINSFIFVSNFSYNKHIQHNKDFKKAFGKVLYNFSNEDVLDASLEDSSIDTFNSYYLFYGRLSAEKGLKTFIDACVNHPQLQFLIVGTGPLETELKRECLIRGLNNIKFLGYKTGSELYELIKHAKFVCVPSECYENNPMTIIESYTLSSPVIGADIGGISELVEDKINGFLFKSGSSSSLSDAIAESSAIEYNDYIAMKKHAKEFAIKNFDKENYYISLMELYERHINKN